MSSPCFWKLAVSQSSFNTLNACNNAPRDERQLRLVTVTVHNSDGAPSCPLLRSGMPDVSQLAQRHEQQDDFSSTPARRLLSDPAFPVPAEPCLPGPPLAYQDVKQDSFLASWWSKVLDSSAAANSDSHDFADRPSLQPRLQRRKHRSHSINGQSMFDLKAINLQLLQVVQSSATNCLELPRYTGKAQKGEVCYRCKHLARD